MSVLARDYGLKIISGGQIGADLAGLRAAQSVGLLTGGMAPKGYRTLKGTQPGLAGFGVVESGSAGYPTRTQRNVMDSDCTVIFAKNLASAGTKLTMDYCEKHARPAHVFQIDMQPQSFRLVKPEVMNNTIDAIAESMKAKLNAKPLEPFVINVAGNSSVSTPRIFVASFVLFIQLLDQLEARLSNGDQVSIEFHQRAATMQQMHVALQLEDVFDPIPQLDPRRALLVL